jgi:hypothetical protein
MIREEMRDMLDIQERELKDALGNDIWVKLSEENSSSQ